MNDFEEILNTGVNGLMEMVAVYINGDDIDRELIDKIHGG
jgi:hypothetical protein